MNKLDFVIIVFKNRTDTLKLYDYLKKMNVKGWIVPTPNSLSVSCGLSLKVRYYDINKVVAVINYLKLTSKFSIYKECSGYCGRFNYSKLN